MNKILIADDDKNICELLKLYLVKAGYEVIICHDGSKAVTLFNEDSPDLVLLDIMLPLINGWEALKMMKAIRDIPIILVTARDMVDDKVQGFELGADDYIVKPFEPLEVIARIKARLKITVAESIIESTVILRIGNLSIDLNKYEVKTENLPIDLKPKEIKLLHFLATNKNIVLSREQLLYHVWNYDYAGDTRTVDVHIKNVREKLGGFNTGISIKTVWSVGYKMEEESC